MNSTETEAARIHALMRDESGEPMDIMVFCPSCRRWRMIFASVKDAKRAGRCDACWEVRDAEKAGSEMTLDEISDALQAVSPKQAADVAARYAAMKDYAYITADGDKLSPKDYDIELEYHHEVLKRYVEQHGPLALEGIGTLRLQERRTAMTWDCKALAENDMDTFMRLLELGCVTLDKRLADAQEKAGNVTSFQQYGHAGGTVALVIDRDEK